MCCQANRSANPTVRSGWGMSSSSTTFIGSTSRTAAPAPLLMNSLIPDSRNVILLEKPSPSRNINSTAV